LFANISLKYVCKASISYKPLGKVIVIFAPPLLITRTLLLYTVLDHYGYDVALMSSDEYGHSILGINLPYNGISYEYNNSRYVLWETTSPNLKPGIIARKISNLNYWKISLKSKKYGK
jgi:hypothetical protein